MNQFLATFGRTIVCFIIAVATWTIGELLYDRSLVAHHIFRDIGIGFFVAAIVNLFFEHPLRIGHRVETDRLLETIGKDVFAGVLSRRLPKSIIQEVENLVLDAKFIREDFSIIYEIGPEREIASANGAQYAVATLTATTSFKLKNVSPTDVEQPIMIGLPNPEIIEMKNEVKVLHARYREEGKQEWTTVDLTTVNASIRSKMDVDGLVLAEEELFKTSIKASKSVEIRVGYIMCKEAEDTEILKGIYPATGLKVTVVDQSYGSRIVRADTIHRLSFTHSNVGATGTSVYELDCPLLPYQGIKIWWKKRPPLNRRIN